MHGGVYFEFNIQNNNIVISIILTLQVIPYSITPTVSRTRCSSSSPLIMLLNDYYEFLLAVYLGGWFCVVYEAMRVDANFEFNIQDNNIVMLISFIL
jgi:hypothetical protein